MSSEEGCGGEGECMVVNGYRIEDGEVLGVGHSSRVVLGRDHAGNKVAVKVVKKEGLSDAGKRLLDAEIKTLKKISHQHHQHQQNLIRLLSVSEEQDCTYVIQEYLHGGDLFEHLLAHKEDFNEKRAKKFFLQMCRGVSLLHQMGVVHHDLKLENTGLRDNDTIAIMDFGFCTEFTPNQLLSRFCGTLSYSSPELLLGKPYPATPVDVWALGVSLFVMLAKRFPFDAKNPETLYRQATSRDYVQSLVHSVPMCDDARDLFMKIFVPNPFRRPSVYEILRHKFLKGVDSTPESAL